MCVFFWWKGGRAGVVIGMTLTSSRKFPKAKSSSFTLVELLVVISIIGLLAGLGFPAITGAIQAGKGGGVGHGGVNQDRGERILCGVFDVSIQQRKNGFELFKLDEHHQLNRNECAKYTRNCVSGGAAEVYECEWDCYAERFFNEHEQHLLYSD